MKLLPTFAIIAAAAITGLYISSQKPEIIIYEPEIVAAVVEVEPYIEEIVVEEKIEVVKEPEQKVEVKKVEPVKVEPKTYTVEEVYNEWSPSVVRVYCVVLDSRGNNKRTSDGSGFLTRTGSGRYAILTTPHVFNRDDVKSDYCDITFPYTNEIYRSTAKDFIEVGGIFIDNVSDEVKREYSRLSNDETGEANCLKIDTGEKIMILGYPSGSDKSKVSYTTGEILRYDGDFYISTAKILPGYSGGIAVSMKNNCFFGIPTHALKENPDYSMIFDMLKF
jgi:hypothetical protein